MAPAPGAGGVKGKRGGRRKEREKVVGGGVVG